MNISWLRDNKREFDELEVRIVAEPTKTCTEKRETIGDWKLCSSFNNPEECYSRDACAISTGGSSSVEER